MVKVNLMDIPEEKKPSGEKKQDTFGTAQCLHQRNKSAVLVP